MLAKAKIQASVLLRLTCLAIALFGGLSALLAESAAAQSNPPFCPSYPLSVSSGVGSDSAIGSRLPGPINCFAWQNFLALTWKADPGNNGQPDPAATAAQYGTPGDPSPVVFETYKPDTAVFLPDAAAPNPWNNAETLPASCKAKSGLVLPASPKNLHVLISVSKFDRLSSDLAKTLQASGQPLFGQNHHITYYNAQMNEDEFNYIVQNQFYDATKQAAAVQVGGQGILLPYQNSAYGPTGAIEAKSAWLEIEDPALWTRYLMMDAVIVDPKDPRDCKTAHMGLVGLHIIRKSPSFQNLNWATFEQVDNVPGPGAEPHGGKYTYNDPKCPPTVCVPNTVPKLLGAVTQVTRVNPILSETATLNSYVQQMIKTANPKSVFQYYQMVDSMWAENNATVTADTAIPLPPSGVGLDQEFIPGNNGKSPHIVAGLANTTLETYVQGPGDAKHALACYDCHRFASIATGLKPAPVCGSGKVSQCASDYSFMFQEARCPAGTPSCQSAKTLGQLRLVGVKN